MIFISGRRETGKTDFSLLIAEILHANNVMVWFASNIKIYDSPFPIEHITNLQDLRSWCQNHKGKKLFVFDEVGKSLRRRSPMSSLNIALLDDLQILRKYKLSIILIAPHQRFVDSASLGSDMLDGQFLKPNYKNPKIAYYISELDQSIKTITHIPKTNIHYDTWDVAPFKERGTLTTPKFKGEDEQLLWDWSHDKLKDIPVAVRVRLMRVRKKFIKESMESKSNELQLLVREDKAREETKPAL
jgi:hypothetical protein